MMALELVVAKYGKTHCLLASKVDARTLTFGSQAAIKAEIDATLSLAAECAGFIFAVGNLIPSNISVENAVYYFDHLKRRWQR